MTTVDLGVGFDGDADPRDVVYLWAGEHAPCRCRLRTTAPLPSPSRLVAPLRRRDAAGLVGNLYRYDDSRRGSLGYEASRAGR